MFKSWRSDKKKIKVTFKLQFQATQVPKLKKPALIISLIPEDVGKPTFKLQKAAVQEGICLWENPVYVTVKLNKEVKTGKLHEKIYHFIVSSGSSKSGYLGEASIDFADFAEEIEPTTVDLPLKFANSGAIIHVTIERVLGDTEQRCIDDNGDLTLSQDGSFNKQLSIGDSDGNDTALAYDIHNTEVYDSTLKQDKVTVNGASTEKFLHRRSSTDWSLGSVSDGSLIDSTNSPDDNLLRESRDTSDEIEKLKTEIFNLTRQAELSDLELQTLRKQITKENKRTQDLLRQITDLKEERDGYRVKCEQIKSSQKVVDKGALNQLKAEREDFRLQLEEIKRELSHEKEVNTGLQSQLQKTQDSNSELIVAVSKMDQMLEQKNIEISDLSSKIECTSASANESDSLKQKITDVSEEFEAYKEDRRKLENYVEQLTKDYEDLKLENNDLSSELNQSHLRELETRNELSESLTKIKGLEFQMQELEETLKKRTQEFSETLVSINELQSRIKGFEKELEKQAQEFENDLHATTEAKIEQEQRAIRAEEALRNTRWKNAVTAERLQEELKRLSVDMAGKLDENEKLMRKAVAEKTLMEQQLQKANKELAISKDRSKQGAEEESQLQKALLTEIEMLKPKIEMLKKESTKDTNKKWTKERDQMDRKLEQAKKEAEKARQEVTMLTSAKGEKETMIKNLLSEHESLKARQNVTESRTETELRAKNKSMEEELKEMQERYSDLSLKFAMVEGERQQLVMVVRNLKYGKKN